MAKAAFEGSSSSEKVNLEKERIDQKTNNAFGVVFRNFAHDVRAIAYIAPTLDRVISDLTKNTKKELDELFKEIGVDDTQVVEKTEKKDENSDVERRFFEIKADMQTLQKVDFFHKLQKANPILRSSRIIGKSLIITLISQFDSFEASLLSAIYNIWPSKIDGSKKTFTLADLKSFDSIDDARNHLIEDEIDAVLRGSHKDHMDAISRIGRFEIARNTNLWKNFIELTERRNLFAHSGGVVTKQYLNVCREHSVVLPDKVVLGTKLDASPEYVDGAFECLFEMALCLIQVAWRKASSDANRAADSQLIDVSFNLIKEERYSLASRILDIFLNKVKTNWNNESNKRTIIVNLAQSYKWAGDEENCRKVLHSVDWSGWEARFRLVVAVLCDEFDVAVLYMKRVGKDGEVSYHDYLNWPVFQQFRKTQIFADNFRDIFGDQMAAYQIPSIENDVFVDNISNDIDETKSIVENSDELVT